MRRDGRGESDPALGARVTAVEGDVTTLGARVTVIEGNVNQPASHTRVFAITPGIAPTTTGVMTTASNASSNRVDVPQLNCAVLAAGAFDVILRPSQNVMYGVRGNSIQVALVGDSPLGGGVTVTEVGLVTTIHYESGVSTVGDIWGLLADAEYLVYPYTAGTGATVLTAPAANFAATNLTGGLDFVPSFNGGTAYGWLGGGRTLRVVLPAGWDGGVLGLKIVDMLGVEKYITSASGAPGTADTNYTALQLLAVFKTAVGVGTNKATIGIGEAFGVPVEIADETGLMFRNGVFETAQITAGVYQRILPATPPAGENFHLVLNVFVSA